jgi:hypothetical protein
VPFFRCFSTSTTSSAVDNTQQRDQGDQVQGCLARPHMTGRRERWQPCRSPKCVRYWI